MFVSGWALDTSIYAERGGVSHVFLELDGAVLKDTRGAFGTLGAGLPQYHSKSIDVAVLPAS